MPSSRVRVLALGVGLLAIIGQFLLTQYLISAGLLPDPIATHWGFSGEPDGFGPAGAHSILVSGIYLALLALMGYLSFGLKRRLLQPLLFSIAGFVSGFMFVFFSFTTYMQIGLSAQEARIEPWLMLSLLIVPFTMVALVLGTPKVSLGKDLRVYVRGLNLLTLSFESLERVEAFELRAIDFGGLGIRYGKKTLAFISTAGPGVLITTNFGESVAIRSESPELLLAAISAKIGSK